MFPANLEFPFARAREIALSGMHELSGLPDATPLALDHLPWQTGRIGSPHSAAEGVRGEESEQGGSTTLSVRPPAISKRRFCITQSRVSSYGPTDGCFGCEPVPYPKLPGIHNPTCVERFRALLSNEPGSKLRIIEEKPTASEPANCMLVGSDELSLDNFESNPTASSSNSMPEPA